MIKFIQFKHSLKKYQSYYEITETVILKRKSLTYIYVAKPHLDFMLFNLKIMFFFIF